MKCKIELQRINCICRRDQRYVAAGTSSHQAAYGAILDPRQGALYVENMHFLPLFEQKICTFCKINPNPHYSISKLHTVLLLMTAYSMGPEYSTTVRMYSRVRTVL